MRLLVYTNQKSAAGKRLHNKMSGLPGIYCEFIHTHMDVEDSFRQRPGRNRIILFLASDNQDLSFIRSLTRSYSNTKLILILPNRRKNTVTLGLLAYPRFVSYADGNFKDICAVIQKIAEYEAIEELRAC